ncbi:hypothetical protein [Sulfolobus acidocaldarius]|nr:hypothetical protein [Sulfolobus acidocaldarius]AGE70418.1 hypothetical protein SacN8_02185 [Sulfolobus acidocaldarius N8]AGE72692.1 hypothetical protein SacRon12I_02180 [Sulfolobus acidocaldarius Ron12/I]ALU29195.1 hypothetical protein ATY89_04085 [Sulfolobus acidocaldarius]ALU31922.1 hypothetical protein ATZ20_07110 [Sulfolobus acidocaldarius]WCM34417.1 hypothetical protein GO597_03185 [Sulfolobus acidocaldarius DSM 639]
MGKEDLKAEILKIIEENRQGITSTQIRDILMEKGIQFNMVEFREILADLVREGKIKKEPDYEKKKFLFKI